MNRTLYQVCIQATKINDDLIRVSTDCDKRDSMWSNVAPEEWDFLENILESFTRDKNPVTAILEAAKEYKGYDG